VREGELAAGVGQPGRWCPGRPDHRAAAAEAASCTEEAAAEAVPDTRSAACEAVAETPPPPELREMTEGGQQSGPASEVARQAADRADRPADWLGKREPGDLVEEVRSFARRRRGCSCSARRWPASSSDGSPAESSAPQAAPLHWARPGRGRRPTGPTAPPATWPDGPVPTRRTARWPHRCPRPARPRPGRTRHRSTRTPPHLREDRWARRQPHR
jgi:hypothetical protein